MKTILLIYILGFIINPIICIKLNKKHPESIWEDANLKNSDAGTRMGRLIFTSVFWPIALIAVFYSLLDYWYLKK